MGPDTFFELSRRSIIINKSEETKLLWTNSYLTVKTDKALHFFNFSYNLNCLDKNIDFVESRNMTPKHSPASELFNARFLKNDLKSSELSELVLDSCLWPHNEQLIQEMTVMSAFDWSPKGFLHNEGVLAILNNIGGIELFVIQDYEWESILNLSEYIKQYLEYNENPKTFQDLKDSIYTLATSMICWAPVLNPDNSCYFVTVQKNGAILIWSIEHDITKICIKGKIENYYHFEITDLIWIPKSDDKFYLVCANILGQIVAFECHIDSEKISLLQYHFLWKYTDRMVPKHMNYSLIDNKIVFICCKHRHLLVQILDENFTITSEHLRNLNDYQITSINNTTDGFFVATVNCKLYKCNIKLTNEALNVDLQLMEYKDPFHTHELYSANFSTNNVIMALGVVDRKMLCRKEAYKLDIVLMSTDKKLESLVPKLLSTQSFTNHWDCIELLRYKITRYSMVSQADCDQLLAAEENITKTKVSLILATIYKNLKNAMMMTSTSGLSLADMSVEKLKEEIFLHAATSLMTSLFNQYQQESYLDSFDDKSFVGARKYVEYFCKKYDKNMSLYYDLPMINASEWCDEYICQCCDDKLDGFTCKDGHLNVFCSQTFTPIQSYNYLVCRCCGYTVRLELIIRNPLCIFCGLYLINTYTPSH